MKLLIHHIKQLHCSDNLLFTENVYQTIYCSLVHHYTFKIDNGTKS